MAVCAYQGRRDVYFDIVSAEGGELPSLLTRYAEGITGSNTNGFSGWKCAETSPVY